MNRVHGYSRDSFDRFGDDLCEVLLSYHTFEDKFRFECVSKQWRRLIFNRQHLIDIRFVYNYFDRKINVEVLKLALKKCRNVTSLVIDLYLSNVEEVFDMIVKSCDKLTSIQTDFERIPEKTVEEFCDKFGPKLTKIIFKRTNYEVFKDIVKRCPKVRTLSGEYNFYRFHLSHVFDGNKVLVKNLRSFEFTYNSCDFEMLKIFVENNKRSLRSISLYIVEKDLTEDHILSLFKQLSKLSNLRTFKMCCNSNLDQSLAQFLLILSTKCPNIWEINLRLRTDSQLLCENIYKSLNFFNDLQIFAIENYSPSVVITETPKECHKLIHLKSLLRLSDRFFVNIDRHFPRLQHISVGTLITNRVLESVAKLPALRHLDLSIDQSCHISDRKVIDIIKKCLKLTFVMLITKDHYCKLNDLDIEKVRKAGHHNFRIKWFRN